LNEKRKRELIGLVDSECKKRAITVMDIPRIIWIAITIVIVVFLVYSIIIVRDIIFLYAASLPVEMQTGYMANQLLVFAALIFSALGLIVSLYMSVLNMLRTSIEK